MKEIYEEATNQSKMMCEAQKKEIFNNTLKENKKLNQEIKRLKEEYVMLQNASDEVEEELQQRIDKAIEYITTEQLYTNYQWGEEFYSQLLKDLLNILKGDDKE